MLELLTLRVNEGDSLEMLGVNERDMLELLKLRVNEGDSLELLRLKVNEGVNK